MEQNTALLKQNAVLADQVDELYATVRELTQTIKELKERLNKSSNNSSKPPSSDGLKKPLIAMRKVKDKALAAGKDEVSYYHLHKFDKQYDELLKTAYEVRKILCLNQLQKAEKP